MPSAALTRNQHGPRLRSSQCRYRNGTLCCRVPFFPSLSSPIKSITATRMNTTANDMGSTAAGTVGWDQYPSAPAAVAFNTDNTIQPDIVAMDEDNEARSDQVALVDKDGFEVWCSRAKVLEQSGQLFEMILGGRIHLPVSSSEAFLLARGIDARISGWDCYSLEQLMQAVNLFSHYDLRQWERSGLETAIIDRLERPDEEAGPSPKLRDRRFADRLVYTAQQGSMYRLWSFIDKQGLCSAVHYDPGDDRPRKRRKVSTEWVYQCIECS